jgi:hypothetical protein
VARAPFPDRDQLTEHERLEYDRWSAQMAVSPKRSEPYREALEELRRLRVRILNRMREEAP